MRDDFTGAGDQDAGLLRGRATERTYVEAGAGEKVTSIPVSCSCPTETVVKKEVPCLTPGNEDVCGESIIYGRAQGKLVSYTSLICVQREEVKQRSWGRRWGGVGRRTGEPGSNPILRVTGDIPEACREEDVVGLGRCVLSKQFLGNQSTPGGEERNAIHYFEVADHCKVIAHQNRRKAGGIGNHFGIGGGAAVGGRAERVVRVTWDANRVAGCEGVRVVQGIQNEAVVRTTVGSSQRRATQSLLNGVLGCGIVQTHNHSAAVGVRRAFQPEIPLRAVDEGHLAGQGVTWIRRRAFVDQNMTGDDTPVGQAIAENGQVRISFRRKAAHLGKSGELPERDSVGGEFEEQVARDDHLLGAYGHRAAPEDVSSAKRGVSGKSRKLADNRDLLHTRSQLSVCGGSIPAQHKQDHQGRNKEGETPPAGFTPCGAAPRQTHTAASGSRSEEFFCIRDRSSPFHCQSLASVSRASALFRICMGFIGILLRHRRNAE